MELFFELLCASLLLRLFAKTVTFLVAPQHRGYVSGHFH